MGLLGYGRLHTSMKNTKNERSLVGSGLKPIIVRFVKQVVGFRKFGYKWVQNENDDVEMPIFPWFFCGRFGSKPPLATKKRIHKDSFFVQSIRRKLNRRLCGAVKRTQNLAVKNAFIGYESEVACP